MPPPIRANASTQRGCLATCGVLVFDSLSRASSSSSSSRPASFTQLVTHNFVTHNLLPTTLSHTHNLSHTTCHPQLCHTQLVTHNFVTHNLSPTTLSHTTCHTQLVTHNFVTHNLSPTTLSHTTCHTQLVTHNFVTHNPLSHTTCHVAGVALGDDHLRFAWQALHLATTCHPQLCHTQLVAHNLSPTTLSHTTCHVAGVHLRFSVAGVALGDMCLRFTWQAWHLATSTCVLRGRRGTYGTGLASFTSGIASQCGPRSTQLPWSLAQCQAKRFFA